jgi:hypothetical protein
MVVDVPDEIDVGVKEPKLKEAAETVGAPVIKTSAAAATLAKACFKELRIIKCVVNGLNKVSLYHKRHFLSIIG